MTLNVMSYWSDVKSYAISSIEEGINSQKARLTVSKNNPIDSDTITLSLTWDKEFENPVEYEGDTQVHSVTRRVTVKEGTVHKDTSYIFNRLTEQIKFNCDIDSITLKETSTIMDSSFTVMYGLSKNGNISRFGVEALDDLCSLGLKSQFNASDVVECEVLYSDLDENRFSSVNAHVRTETPWDYLPEVKSSSEIKKGQVSHKGFISSNQYIVPFSVRRTELPDLRIKSYERYMRFFVEEHFEACFDYKLEGGSIYIKSGDVTSEDYCISEPRFEYSDPESEEIISCWVYANATEVLGFDLS